MVQIRKLDSSNVRYKDAVEYADAYLDSFEKDAMVTLFFPPRYQLTTITPADRQKLLHTAARKTYLNALRGTNFFYVLEEIPGRAEAVSMWQWPEYHKPKPANRLYTWLVSLYVRVADWWTFLGSSNPYEDPAMTREYGVLMKTSNAIPTPERLKELASCTPQQLETEVYPRDYCYACRMLAVRQNSQGKGYGRKIMSRAEQDMPNEGPTFGTVSGPAKLALFSSPVAHDFYKRMGYSLVASFDSKLENGDILPHRYFHKTVTVARSGAPASAA